MPGRNFLFVPGPTNVPDRVMRAMMVAMEDHRSSRFPELTLSLFQRAKHEIGDGATHRWQAWLRRWSADSFFPASLL
jgi:aspartate aminotransferase-like enzyme